jgi:hypothetical protein
MGVPFLSTVTPRFSDEAKLMKIKKIIEQRGRAFTAIYICEHCDQERTSGGYDDLHFHHRALPRTLCLHCARTRTAMQVTTSSSLSVALINALAQPGVVAIKRCVRIGGIWNVEV